MTKRPMINRALKLARLYWGFTQVQLADQLGVSQSLISEVEKEQKDVSLDLLQKYSSTLNVSMSNLLFFAEEIEVSPVKSKGHLIIAENALKILERLKPNEPSAA